MTRPYPESSWQSPSRREALKYLGGIAAGLLATGCTPLRIALGAYPDEFRSPDRVERALRAFATTVVPGVRADQPGLCRVFYDAYYPMHKYRNFLASDLCDRSMSVVGMSPFEALPDAERARVIQHGLDAGGTIARLYAGAVYLIQIALLAGIYEDQDGCALIGFEGQYKVRSMADLTYPDPERFLARAITNNGNPS